MSLAIQVAPSAEVATAKNLASCREFLVEDTYPAPPRPALSCMSSSSSMTSVASASHPASALHGKHDTLKTLASAAERSGASAQQAETLGQLGEQLAHSLPGAPFGQPGQPSPNLSPNSKADPSRQPGASKSDAGLAPLSFSAAQQGSAAAKLPSALGQPVHPQQLGHTNSSKSEASKGAMAARTLMFFKGCPRALGCTVLLKGAPRHVLAAVKKVMEVRAYTHRAVFVVYSRSEEQQ